MQNNLVKRNQFGFLLVMQLLVTLILGSLGCIAGVATAEEEWKIPPAPSLALPVVDETGTFTQQDIADIGEAAANSVTNSTKGQIAVYMTNKIHRDLEDDSLAVARAWNPGGKDRQNGVLLYIARDDHKMRIEVAGHVEDTLTTVKSKEIIEKVLAPKFKQGDYVGGTYLGVSYIRGVLNNDDEYIKDYRDPQTQNRGISGFELFLIVVVILFILFYANAKTSDDIHHNDSNKYKGGGFWGGFGGGGLGGGGFWTGGGGSDSGGNFGGGSFGGGGGFTGAGSSGSW